MGPGREPMTGVDLAWLRMERTTNPMMIVGVLTLAGRVTYASLRMLLEERLMRFERFRQLPMHDALGTHWETDEDFRLESHLRRLTLPPRRATQPQLEAAASKLASTQLDPRRPLWQIHLVERYRTGSAVIARFHHCYADGVALMHVLLSLTDPSPLVPDRNVHRVAAATGGNSRSLLSAVPLVESSVTAMQGLAQGALDLVSASLKTLAHPEQATETVGRIAAAGSELARIAVLPEDPPTPLKAALSRHKHVAWVPPLSLEEVKTIGSALGCTINDVLLACAAGALGAYLRRRGLDVAGLTIRALVPVNLRPAKECEPALGNNFGLVFVNLPVSERNPLARLYSIHQEMERLKHSSQAILSLWLLTAMGSLPGAIEERSVELFTSKASVVISNVPGPRGPLYLAGARIDQQFFWVPQAGSIGVGISLLTYDGRVHFGLIADRNLIDEPRQVARSFADEFERLLLCVIAGPAA